MQTVDSIYSRQPLILFAQYFLLTISSCGKLANTGQPDHVRKSVGSICLRRCLRLLPAPTKKGSGFFLTFYYQYNNIIYVRTCTMYENQQAVFACDAACACYSKVQRYCVWQKGKCCQYAKQRNYLILMKILKQYQLKILALSICKYLHNIFLDLQNNS